MPMSIDSQKRKTELGSPGKERAKTKKKEKREQEINRNSLEAIRNEGLDEPEKTQQQPASSSADMPKTKQQASTGGSSTNMPENKQQSTSSTGGSSPSTNMPKKTMNKQKSEPITKQTYQPLAPSILGLQ